MRKLSLITLSIACAWCCQAQAPFKRNDIYLEAGGAGLFGSVNYERQLSKMPGLGLRVGLGFYSENRFYLTIPVGVHYLFPLRSRGTFIDAGLAYTPAFGDGRVFADKEERDNFNSFLPSIGYRKHTRKDLMFRASASAVVNYSGAYPWLGISIGKRF